MEYYGVQTFRFGFNIMESKPSDLALILWNPNLQIWLCHIWNIMESKPSDLALSYFVSGGSCRVDKAARPQKVLVNQVDTRQRKGPYMKSDKVELLISTEA